MNKIIINNIPNFTYKFFWDVNPEILNIKKDYFFIVERLLEYADDKTIRWLLNNYNENTIVNVVKKSRKLSPKTAFFWMHFLNLKEEHILCLREYCQQSNSTF